MRYRYQIILEILFSSPKNPELFFRCVEGIFIKLDIGQGKESLYIFYTLKEHTKNQSQLLRARVTGVNAREKEICKNEKGEVETADLFMKGLSDLNSYTSQRDQ